MVEVKNNIMIKMGWKYLSYINGEEKIVFKIEPMVGEADIIYTPNDEIWKACDSKWASQNRKKILNDIKSVEWNRNIAFNECNIGLKCMPVDKTEIEEGTMESTKAAKEFQTLYLFDPDKKVEKEQAHELWCTLEKRFAKGVEGKVTIYANSIIENSVFNKISIVTLLENDKVILNIVDNK
ncbi:MULTISPECIES: hypothetical protein [Clostridium]|uniref:Uncharacterized protein n=1 Tax=Clostridium frigoriphilum TaxID=443253 RepID=A0ABU7UY94_9CLOT|nr:hypothetical protein [Clostridium sp. DSM 17811]MBU3102326.1 hypothetical protein [Clostridium sp. DSM 17811]